MSTSEVQYPASCMKNHCESVNRPGPVAPPWEEWQKTRPTLPMTPSWIRALIRCRVGLSMLGGAAASTRPRRLASSTRRSASSRVCAIGFWT